MSSEEKSAHHDSRSTSPVDRLQESSIENAILEKISLIRCQREFVMEDDLTGARELPSPDYWGESKTKMVPFTKEDHLQKELLYLSSPTQPKITFNDEEEDTTERDFLGNTSNNIDVEISQLRLTSDLSIPEEMTRSMRNPSGSFLRAFSGELTSKRRSPVTVQEWVASLPMPEIFSGEENRKDSVDESLDQKLSNITKESRTQVFSKKPEKTGKKIDCKEEQAIRLQMLGDELKLGSSEHNLRRLSKSFEAIEEAKRESKELSSSSSEDEAKENDSDDDHIKLGEEAATSFKENVAKKHDQSGPDLCKETSKPSVQKNQTTLPFSDADFRLFHDKKNRSFLPSLSSSNDCRRLLLLQSHEQYASVQSNLSIKTVSSIETVFLSRAVDPAELLFDLGFGGSPLSTISRIPPRFFASKSFAKGVSVEEFLKKQEELTERFDSGFNGYRGLNGSSSARPSKLVEKIIEKIRSQDSVFRRQWSNLSAASIYGTSGPHLHRQNENLLVPNSENQNIPARFRAVVQHAWNLRNSEHVPSKSQLQQGSSSPVNKFRAVASSVLSPANRRFMVEQARKANEAQKDRNKRRIVIGGQAYSVDDEDLSVTQVEKSSIKKDEIELEENDVVPELGEEKAIFRRLSGGPKRAPPISMLHKQDSMASVTSSYSVESDWSDEEKDKLIRAFDDLQERSLATEKNELAKIPQIRRKMGMRSLNPVRRETSGSITSVSTCCSTSDEMPGPESKIASKSQGARLIYSRLKSQTSVDKCDSDNEN